MSIMFRIYLQVQGRPGHISGCHCPTTPKDYKGETGGTPLPPSNPKLLSFTTIGEGRISFELYKTGRQQKSNNVCSLQFPKHFEDTLRIIGPSNGRV